MNTFLTITYGFLMALVGFIFSYKKAEKHFKNENSKNNYDEGWLDCERYYKENFELIPIDTMLSDNCPEYDGADSCDLNDIPNPPSPVDFLKSFEEFLETVPDD